ncbi:MAG TPA: hypothetical protein VFA53_07460 [Xanthobacteraceae bacterium]|nr:hypothetical protein [Xanthobacteraceae bacterium]
MTLGIGRQFDRRALIRVASWGTAAAAALAVAGLSTLSPTAAQRIADASEPQRQAALEQQSHETETRRLNEAIRLLAADRDRLMNRLASLERNVDDMTGSINRQTQQPPVPPLPAANAPDTTAALPAIPAAVPQSTPSAPPAADIATGNSIEWRANPFKLWPKDMPALASAEASGATFPPLDAPAHTAGESETPFGADVGGGPSLEQVRILWRSLSTKHGQLFSGLHPVIALRESRPGVLDIRLIVGPLADADAAARLCAALLTAKIKCAPHSFDGQRLAER